MISEKWRHATEDELIAEYQKVATTIDNVRLCFNDLKKHDLDFAKAIQKHGGINKIQFALFFRWLTKFQQEFDQEKNEIISNIIRPLDLKVGESYRNETFIRKICDMEDDIVCWSDNVGEWGECSKSNFCLWAVEKIKDKNSKPNLEQMFFWRCCKGHEFEATGLVRIKAFSKGQEDCPDCIRGRYSKGEDELYKIVASIFPKEKIERGYTPDWLRSSFGGQMHLDVALIDKKIAFEFQGQQHFKPVELWGGEKAFKKNVQRDKDKRELCRKNNWRLIEITYHWYNKGCPQKYIENAITGNYDAKIYNQDLGKTTNAAYRTSNEIVITKTGEEYFRKLLEEHARINGLLNNEVVKAF